MFYGRKHDIDHLELYGTTKLQIRLNSLSLSVRIHVHVHLCIHKMKHVDIIHYIIRYSHTQYPILLHSYSQKDCLLVLNDA